jgi:hypothetical protein
MAKFYGNVGIWTGTFGSIPLVIEVTSLKKPTQTTTAVAGQSCAPAAETSLQLRVIRLGFLQDGGVGIGVFPQDKKIVGALCVRC